MMRPLALYFSWLLLASSVLGACQDEHKPDLVEAKTDSLITITIPDFALIVNSTQTPKGKLDRITTVSTEQYTPTSPIGQTTSTQQFLYDAQGRITGHTVLASPSKGIDNAVIYEYKENRPYRIFSKGGEYGSQVISFYFMTEMVYDQTGRENARLYYMVDLKGNARLQSRYRLIYDAQNRVSEIKAANGNFLGQVFSYEKGNLTGVQSRSPDGRLLEFRYDFRYETGTNPLKGIYWQWNGDRWYDWSINNLLSRTTVYDNSIPTSPVTTDYTNRYDEAGRLIRQSSVWAQGSISSTFYYQP